MINYINAILSPISIHYIGRKFKEEDYVLSDIPTVVNDEYLQKLILKYFLSGFKEPAFFNFKLPQTEMDIDNPVYEYVNQIFDDPESMHYVSGELGKYLHTHSLHPNIKEGEIMVCHFKDILVEDELLEGIGIFKCESKAVFLKLLKERATYTFGSEDGIALGGLDKGCLILNTDRSTGYKVVVLDKANSSEAYFWKKEFLNVVERSDDYHHTSHYINLTKDFVEDRLKPKHDLGKDDELRIMNSSEKFFQTNETFTEKEYLNTVFDNPEVLEEFEDYKNETAEIRGRTMDQDFDISAAAVKKNAKVFKSVIKLDRNFTLYVHGERNKIERGVDDEGRKFYKMFYDNES